MNLDQLQEDKDVMDLSSAKICGASEWCNQLMMMKGDVLWL
jgi:hypothetical protein